MVHCQALQGALVLVGGLTLSYFYWEEVYQRALERGRYLDELLRPIQERLRIEEALLKEAALKLAKALARARVIEKCKRIKRRMSLDYNHCTDESIADAFDCWRHSCSQDGLVKACIWIAAFESPDFGECWCDFDIP